jgi:hypothetical protein
MPYDQLIADAGYDSEANHRFCREELGVDSLIAAKKRRSATVVATTPYRQEMVRRLGKSGDPAETVPPTASVGRSRASCRWSSVAAARSSRHGWNLPNRHRLCSEASPIMSNVL